jgi:hypothetical protein
VAQDIEIQDVLGTKLYEKLLTLIRTAALVDNYLTLVSTYVQPTLIHYAMADFLQFHGYEISNAGILRNNPENTQLPEKAEIDALISRQRAIAETYRLRLVSYLCYYPQLFPEYTANQNDGQYPSSNPNNYCSLNI